MKSLRFGRYALSTCVAAVMLAACGGSGPPVSGPGTTGATPSFSHYRFFKYTGGEQSFKVPAGVTHLTITAYGARGADGLLYPSGYASSGGSGGMVTAKIPVTPGERLAIFVGASGGRGGFNGGGGVTGSSCPKGCAGIGGGASDVRQGGDGLADRVIVAAGGGGGASDGYSCYTSHCSGGGTSDGGSGGGGGGRTGRSGTAGSASFGGGGGSGGTQRTGGEGGPGGGGSTCGGSDGTLGSGGLGGPGRGCGANGGGGGGGYYGGGGGGGGGFESSNDQGPGGGGGGGSSFAESHATHVKITNDGQRGDGSILVFW